MVAAAFALALLLAGPSAAAPWRLVPEGSALRFEADWEGQPVPGGFARFDAAVTLDPERPQAARFEVSVDMASVTAATPDVVEALAGPQWFDVEGFPRARFVGRGLSAAGGDYRLDGELTLKGVTQPVRLALSWEARPPGLLLQGSGRLDRRVFDVGSGEWADDPAIGSEVRVRFSLLLAPAVAP